MTIVPSRVRKFRAGFKFSVFVVFATAFAFAAKAFDTAPYFPLSTDSAWRYVVTASDRHTPNTIFIRKEVGITVFNDTPVHVVQDTLNNDEHYYTNDGNGVRDHGSFDPAVDAGSAGLVGATGTYLPPQILLLPNATLGVPVTSSGTLNFAISGIGTFPLSYTLTSTPEAFETVKSTVNSHTYRKVLRIRTVTTGSGTITIKGRSASLNLTTDETDWLVPTLGLVKSSSTSTRPGAAPRHEEIELLGGSLQDDMPVVQTIPPVIGAIPNSTVTSAPFTVSGINIEANIVVSAGDKYSIDGGPFTDVSGGTVGDGQSVRLQTTAPPGLGQGIDRIVFIGSGRAALTVTTQLPPTGPYTGLFFYIVQPGNPISRQYSFQLPNVNDTGQILPFGGIGIPIVAGDVVAVAKNYGDGCCSAAFYTPVGKKLTAGTVENAEFGFVSLGSPFTLGVNGGAAVGYRHNFTGSSGLSVGKT
ncbi:MAG: hypothetical protein HYX63_20435 [Gammaproteobacteria bacterium]|nr:hypothetical protein [Gammaproteobacteria bacterium]